MHPNNRDTWLPTLMLVAPVAGAEVGSIPVSDDALALVENT